MLSRVASPRVQRVWHLYRSALEVQKRIINADGRFQKKLINKRERLREQRKQMVAGIDATDNDKRWVQAQIDAWVIRMPKRVF